MLVGETIDVSLVETRQAEFAIESSSLAVVDSAGNPSSPSVTVAPGTSSLTQTLSAMLTPETAGAYSLAWSYVDGGGETIKRPRTRFAWFTDVPQFVLGRLQRQMSEVPEGWIEAEFAKIVNLLLSRWPQIGNGLGTAATMGIYSSLSGPDQGFFDEAASLLVCARLVGPLTTGGAASDAVGFKRGDREDRFVGGDPDPAKAASPGDPGAGAGGYTGSSERLRWCKEAAERLAHVSWISQTVQARAQFSPFRVSGPTSGAYREGQVQTLLSDVLRLISYTFDLEPAMETTGI